jgi:MOSC domain-containing protein YiiM
LPDGSSHPDKQLNLINVRAIGSTVLEVTSQPHNGCAKFSERFGANALRFVNTTKGRALHLRGRSTRVVTAGLVRCDDEVRRLDS